MLVTTYQHAAYIAACLDGVLAQRTDFAVEVLVGEDESTDGTRAICQRYAERHPDRIRLFLRERKDVMHIGGRATGRANLLHLLGEARGTFIALCEGARNEVLLGAALHAAALVRQWAGQPAEAVPFLTRALANAERRLGPEHPNLAATLTTLASVQSELGDRVASRAAAERAVAVYTASVGADSPMIVGPMVALANDAAELGHFAEAVPRYRRALAILDRDPEANVASRALVSSNLGGALAEWQRFEEALPLLRRSLALHEARLGSEHAELAWPLLALGFALRSVGELTEARTIQERVRAIIEHTYGVDHVYLSYPLSELAQLDVEVRAWPSAVRNAERALALQRVGPAAPEEIATTRFILAMALDGAGARPRALALAREAATALHALGDTSAADVDAWITEHTAKPATAATP